jgi:NADPH:quinone reductase-like Zn-dependent oxidoreductase
MTTSASPRTGEQLPIAAATMRAIVQHTYGTADTWSLVQTGRPVIGDDEVLVRVRAAGLDRGTWHLMTGTPYAMRLALGFRGPKVPVPGRDLSGVVEAVGAAVTRFEVGDEVLGTGKGAFAELAAVPEDKLVPKPSSLSFEAAAALPISGSTGLRAVDDGGRVAAGQKVLVIGASGGVGSFAVQIATARGAEVTGVCSAAKADLVRSLGAAHVLDYRRDDALDGKTSYDVIIDIAGNAPLRRLRRSLAARGTLVIVGGEDGDRVTGGMGRQLRALVRSVFGRQRMTLVLPKEHFSVLERVARLAEDGEIVPAVQRAYPLDEAATAMRALEAGHVRGKLVITV